MLQAALVCSEGSHGASEASITTVGAEQPRHTGVIADDLHERRLGLVSCRPIGWRGAAQAGAATHLHTAATQLLSSGAALRIAVSASLPQCHSYHATWDLLHGTMILKR